MQDHQAILVYFLVSLYQFTRILHNSIIILPHYCISAQLEPPLQLIPFQITPQSTSYNIFVLPIGYLSANLIIIIRSALLLPLLKDYDWHEVTTNKAQKTKNKETKMSIKAPYKQEKKIVIHKFSPSEEKTIMLNIKLSY